MPRLSARRVRLRNQTWFRISFVILTLSFAFNILSATSIYNFKGFQADSELLVRNTFACQKMAGNGSFSGLLLITTGNNCDKHALPYFPQSGLPFRVLGLLYPNKSHLQGYYFHLLKTALAVISAAMLAGILTTVSAGLRIRYRTLAFLLVALSPWLVVFSVNMFWLLPLLLAPGWFVWLYYPRLKNRIPIFLLILGALFFLKFLVGYEYSSTLTISAICPMLWYELKARTNLKIILKKTAFILAAAIAGFVFALGVNFAQAAHQMGSAEKGFRVIYDRARLRTFSAADPTIGPGIISQLKLLKPADYEYFENLFHLTDHTSNSKRDKLVQNGVVLYQYLAEPSVNLPIALRFPFNVLLTSVTSFLVFTAVLVIKAFKNSGMNFAYKDPLLATVSVAFIGGFSWLVFGYQHSFIHTHINPIVFYLPFLPLAYVLLSRELEKVIHGVRKRRG